MKFNFRIKGKRYDIEVKVCENMFQKMSGLMFRKRSKPLLFVYDKLTYEPIHSFFCVKFVIIWFNGDDIVDMKLVRPWKLSVLPKNKFDKFLEIPKNDINYSRMVYEYDLK
jgi:uncharacterized membrane protein (UPF0127 family)